MTEPPQPPSTPGNPWGSEDPSYSPPPPGQYLQGQYPPAPRPAPGLHLGLRLGPRLTRRPEPRFGISLAAAGVVLAIAGVVIWAGGYLASGLHLNIIIDSNSGNGSQTTRGEGRRFLGAGLSLIVVAVGYALVIIRRRGPLATAGVVASAIGVPLTIGFLTLDVNGVFYGQFPINVDALFIVSILAWAISYSLIPGAQGRSFYLGLAALSLFGYVVYKAEGTTVIGAAVSTVIGGSVSHSILATVAAISLAFGLAYYGIAAALDRAGRTGAAIALVLAGLDATVTGVIAAIPSFHQVGTGVLLIVLGVALTWYGGRFGRRFTTWFWSIGLLLGIGLIVQKIVPHNSTGAGITLILIGAFIVGGAQAFSSATNEAPEYVPAGSEAPVAAR